MKNVKLRVPAALLSAVMACGIFSAVSFENVLADDLDGTITVDGHEFELDTSDMWFKWTDESGRVWIALNNQLLSLHEELHGSLPTSGYYILAGDLTITDGCVYPENPETQYRPMDIDLNGYTLTYNNPDTEEYMIDTKDSLLVYTNIYDGTISDANEAPLFNIDASRDPMNSLELTNVTLSGSGNSYVMDGMSAINVGNGSLTIKDCTVSGFSAVEGGFLYTKSGVRITNTKISNCYAERGGAIYAEDSGVLLQFGSSIENCLAQEAGSAIYLNESYLNLRDSSIRYNTCERYTEKYEGGAVYGSNQHDYIVAAYDGAVIVNNSTPGGVRENVYFCEEIGGNYERCIKIADTASDGTDIRFSMYDYEFDSSIYPLAFYVFGEYSNSNYSTKSIKYLKCEDPDYVFEKTKYFDNNFGLKKVSPDYYSVKGYALRVKGDTISIDYYVKVPSDISGEIEYSYTWDGYLNSSFSDSMVEGSLPDENGVMIFSVDVDSMDMTRPITFTLTVDGVQVLKDEGFTIRDYAYAIFSKPNNYLSSTGRTVTALKTIVASMVSYGAASQKYFGFNTGDLPDDFITSNVKDALESMIPSSYFNNNTYDLTVKNESVVSYYGASMIFKSTAQMKFYFYMDDKTIDKSKLKITISSEEVPVSFSGNYFYAQPVGFPIYDIEKPLVVKVYYDSEEQLTLTYKPINYLSRISANSSNEKMKALSKMTLLYYYALTNSYNEI